GAARHRPRQRGPVPVPLRRANGHVRDRGCADAPVRPGRTRPRSPPGRPGRSHGMTSPARATASCTRCGRAAHGLRRWHPRLCGPVLARFRDGRRAGRAAVPRPGFDVPNDPAPPPETERPSRSPWRTTQRRNRQMSTVMRRKRDAESVSPFDWMDRVFDAWMRSFPLREPFGFAWDRLGDGLIRVDEYRDGDTWVIRAELPGIDPDEDLEITVADGVLRIDAERRIEDRAEEEGYVRRELRYGSMSRTLPLPDGVTESDISATYRDGILEIRVRAPQRVVVEPTKIKVKKG